MADEELPVYIPVTRPDGSTERVRVGTAVRSGDGFLLRLGELVLGNTPARPAAGDVFPNYGRSKGQPIAGASEQDLVFYANGCRRTLADPAKARWHDKERVLLATIEAELARQRGETPPLLGDGPPPPVDDDIPF
jgi:hypothetical protein